MDLAERPDVLTADVSIFDFFAVFDLIVLVLAVSVDFVGDDLDVLLNVLAVLVPDLEVDELDLRAILLFESAPLVSGLLFTAVFFSVALRAFFAAIRSEVLLWGDFVVLTALLDDPERVDFLLVDFFTVVVVVISCSERSRKLLVGHKSRAVSD